jgi:hypothetical protein
MADQYHMIAEDEDFGMRNYVLVDWPCS